MLDCNTINNWNSATSYTSQGRKSTIKAFGDGWEIHSESKLVRFLHSRPSKTSPWTPTSGNDWESSISVVDLDFCVEEVASPKIVKAVTKLEASQNWLLANRDKYRGKWVVLDGEELLGATNDPVPVVRQARENGVDSPFVTYVEEASEPSWMGWQ